MGSSSAISPACCIGRSCSKTVNLERATADDFGGGSRWTEAYMRMKNDSEIDIMPSRVSLIIEKLENFGCVQRRRDRPDRRLIVLQLSDEGLEVYELALKALNDGAHVTDRGRRVAMGCCAQQLHGTRRGGSSSDQSANPGIR
jgi:hypothetical protein